MIKNDWLDYALTIGMTVDEYWYADPSLIYNYAESYFNRKKVREQEIWLQGAYFRSALASVIISVGLADKTTYSKLPDYPPDPIAESARTQQDVESEIGRAERYFDMLTSINNKQRGEL